MSFTPLDTSTQRERISVSRSGTMGVRRPPTRRHTPAALLCSSPEDGPEAQRPDEGQILVDSDDNLRDTPDPDVGKIDEQSGMSIVGFKNISPKIRVGFPVEIQLELQTKLRSSSTTLERDTNQHNRHHHHHHHHHQFSDKSELLDFDRHMNLKKETESVKGTTVPIRLLNDSFDFKERRKSTSVLIDNFESAAASSTGGGPSLGKESQNGGLFSNPFRANLHQFSSRLRDSNDNHNFNGFGNVRRMSWDLLQNIQRQQNMNENSSKLYSTLASGSSGGDEYIPTNHGVIVDEVEDDEEYVRPSSFSQRLHSFNKTDRGHDNEEKRQTRILLNGSRETIINIKRETSYEDDRPGLHIEEIIEPSETDEPPAYQEETFQEEVKHPELSTPDVLHHDVNSDTLSPSLDRSRRLLKMLDETPDLINKMSFKSYFSGSSTEKAETEDWDNNRKNITDSEPVDKDEQMDWETQRQLSFLNDSLSRILDESRSIESVNVKAETKVKTETVLNGTTDGDEDHDGLDMNGNLKDMLGKPVQVSQTWISSVDQKPAQTVRENDIVTSISATNDAYKKGQKRVEFSKTEVHFTPDSGRFNIVETDENKPSTAHLFRRKKRSERKQKQEQQQTSTTISSSSSSMSSLESTTTTEKCETAYIVEMDVSGGDNGDKLKSVKMGKEKTSPVQIEEVPMQEPASLPTLTSANSVTKSESEKVTVDRRSSEGRNSRILINLESVTNEANNGFSNDHSQEFEDDVRSPSHMILSNYGEMKIQRYLKQLKSPSREGSTSPLGSPTPRPTQTNGEENEEENNEDGHFRFDNILYENGSFVPLATRRSLIEMNNRNRKRLNAATSQSSDNSSTTSTYSLPTSEKDQYATLRMGSVEATVSSPTDGSRPQITSVDFNYKNENDMETHSLGASPEGDISERMDKISSDIDYHNLSVRERRERFSSVPSPVLPHSYMNGTKPGRNGLASGVVTPSDSHVSESSQRPSSSAYLSKKPPTPILPLQFATFEKTGAELRERFYAKANSSMNTMAEVAAGSCLTTVSSVQKGEGKSKSIVTIGSDYNEPSSYDLHANERIRDSSFAEITVKAGSSSRREDTEHCTEPVLSLDHTWKGPAHYEDDDEITLEDPLSPTSKTSKSLTFPKGLRPEPEWVSKAKSRETRVTDWSLIEKQQTTTSTTRNTEPPWISEIRFRNKPLPNDDLKSLPKVSVVYPWQKDSSSKESSVERQDLPEESHIVSIVPEPPQIQNGTMSKEEKKYSTYDQYSGKSVAGIKSLKSVPEVSIPIRRSKNKSIVEVHSEPEQYSNPQKYYMSTRKNKEVASADDYEQLQVHTKSKKASSMRVTSDMSSTVAGKQEAETFPKKSRKPLQVTQEHHREKHVHIRGDEMHKRHHSEDKHKAQPKPPKPPQRAVSLTREERSNGGPAIMTLPAGRDHTSRPSHKERYSDGITMNGTHSNTVTNTAKRSTSKRKPAPPPEMTYEPPSPQQQREMNSQPVHHRHPTVQIAKLPMKSSKVAVLETKRMNGSNQNGPPVKAKSKHHASALESKFEHGKLQVGPSRVKRVTGTTVSHDDPHSRKSHHHSQATSVTKPAPMSTNVQGVLRGKPRRTVHQTPLKTSTRSPSLDLETKKRKPNVDVVERVGKRK